MFALLRGCGRKQPICVALMAEWLRCWMWNPTGTPCVGPNSCCEQDLNLGSPFLYIKNTYKIYILTRLVWEYNDSVKFPILSMRYYNVSRYRNLITSSVWVWIPWPVRGGQMGSPHIETGGGRKKETFDLKSPHVSFVLRLHTLGTRVHVHVCWC